MKNLLIVFFLCFFAFLIAAPLLDGNVTANEYRYSMTRSGITLSYDFSGNYFYAAVSGVGKGWIALGLNSYKMDKSLILFGFVKDSTENFSVQRGYGHSHKTEAGLPTAEYKLKETATGTVLEIRIASSALTAGAKVPFIAAYSDGDSFMAMHKAKITGDLTRP